MGDDPSSPSAAGRPWPEEHGQPDDAGVLRTDDTAVWALVASVAGFVVCPIVLHVAGWALANRSLATIRASHGTVGGQGLATAARVLAVVGIVLYAVVALLGVLVLVLLATSLGGADG